MKILAPQPDGKDAHYQMIISWSDEDGCWIADVPDLAAARRTPGEAVAEAREAIALSLDTARDEDIAIPEPRYRTAAA